MIDVIVDTLLDSVKLLPFLLITFIIIELIEHKVDNKKIISKSGKYGPVIGGALGAIPQCGFSVSATNLYSTRIISMGTLIAIYLSTSDEMLPIMISEGTNFSLIIKIIGLKLLIGIFAGLVIDLIFKNKIKKLDVEKLCEEEHCHCEKSIFLSALKHTLNIFIFIIIISFILNTCFHYIGENTIKKIFNNNLILGPFICSLFGLIPNCAASIFLTELYIGGTLTFGSALAGLLTGSGVAILLLFKTNKNIKENINIILITYLIGVLSGIIINLLGV